MTRKQELLVEKIIASSLIAFAVSLVMVMLNVATGEAAFAYIAWYITGVLGGLLAWVIHVVRFGGDDEDH